MYTILIIIPLIFSCCGHQNPYEELLKTMSKVHPSDKKSQHKVKKYENIAEKTSVYEDPDLKIPIRPNLDNTYFCDIEKTHQVWANEVEESNYPWIGRVVHSLTGNVPLICTAAALKEMIFITAGGCLASAKVTYSRVLYHGLRLRPKAFVLPSEPTRQMFDDIGWIVVHPEPDEPQLTWFYIDFIQKPRTDDHFWWFENLGYQYARNVVVGFISPDEAPHDQKLYMLDKMFASNHLCHKITGMSPDSNNYWVPCYHHCTVDEYFKASDNCDPYIVGVGHMVLDENSTLIGVATWACDSTRYGADNKRLPVGMAVPNSKAFYSDLECAIKIREDRAIHEHGYYQSLCDK